MEVLLGKPLLDSFVKSTRGARIFLLQEDAETALRAEKFCSALTKAAAEPSKFIKHSWFANQLKMPRLCQVAANEAAASDIIIFSLHHTGHLPVQVEQWVAAWMGKRKTNGGTMVALLDPLYTGDSSMLQAHLEQIAHTANMDFAAYAKDTPEPNRSML